MEKNQTDENSLIFLYDHVQVGNGFVKESPELVYEVSNSVPHLESLGFVIQKEPLEKASEFSTMGLYVIELSQIYRVCEYGIHRLISQKALNLAKSGKIRIVFWGATEGGNIIDGGLLKESERVIKSWKLPLKPFFIYGDLRVQEKAKKNELESLFFCPVDYWGPSYQHQMKEKWKEESVLKIEKPIHTLEKKKYDFLCYNANPKSHRLALIAELKRKGLDKNSLISLVGRSYAEQGFIDNLNAMAFFNSTHPEFKKISKNIEKYKKNIEYMYLDQNLDSIEEAHGDRRQQSNHYEQSFFSFVTESTLESEVLFPTEKVFKPLLNEHPFIVYGSPGLLGYLRSLGFETFPEFFDESYDEKLDQRDRLEIILESVTQFCNLPIEEKRNLLSSASEKLVHNSEHFKKIKFKDNYNIVIENLRGKI